MGPRVDAPPSIMDGGLAGPRPTLAVAVEAEGKSSQGAEKQGGLIFLQS